MKLHGAIKLGSASVLLNNIDKYVKRGQIWLSYLEKGPLERFRQTRLFGSSLVPFLGSSMPKERKSYWTVLEQMASKCKKSQIWPYRPWKMTFRAIQPNLSFDMWFMSPQRSSMPKKKKSYWSVSEIDPSPPQSWRTDGRTDRRTDRQTDRQTDDGQIGIRKAPLPFGWRS